MNRSLFAFSSLQLFFTKQKVLVFTCSTLPIIKGPSRAPKIIQYSKRESRVSHQGLGYDSILDYLAGPPKYRAACQALADKPLLKQPRAQDMSF